MKNRIWLMGVPSKSVIEFNSSDCFGDEQRFLILTNETVLLVVYFVTYRVFAHIVIVIKVLNSYRF